MSIGPYILYLPDIALESIFSFLTYDEIAKNRVVCKKFNEVGGKYLSRGFVQMEKRHSQLYKRVRSMLPRRESERRVHHLARHCDILSAVETRFSMMNMTFMKYIENSACCFIPGKVLDEFYKILSLIETDASPPKTHELMQELRDISSMAMEHFDEHIAPSLKTKIEKSETQSLFPYKAFFGDTAANTSSPSPSTSAAAARQQPRLFVATVNDQLRKFRRHTKAQRSQLAAVLQHVNKMTRRMRRQTVRLKAQQVQLRDQERRLQEHGTKVQEQEAVVVETKRRVDEWEHKYTQVSNELLETRETLQKLSQQQQQQQEQQQKEKLQQQAQQDENVNPEEADVLDPILPSFFISNIKPREARVDLNFLHRQHQNQQSNIVQDRKRKRPVEYDSLLERDRDFQHSKQSRASIHCDYYIENLRDTLSMIIKENITNNISKSITDDVNQSEREIAADQTRHLHSPANKNFASFLSTSLENLIRGPLSSIASRKRKMQNELDFN